MPSRILPRVFIGSSVEKLFVAHAIQQELDHDCEPTVWPQGVFEGSKTTMASLIAKKFHAAIFVLTPDDLAVIRDSTKQVTRDNVLIEIGFFIGSIGLENTFLILPRDMDQYHFPTDLVGVQPLTYNAGRSDANVQAALGPACTQIRARLKNLVVSPDSKEEDLPESPTTSLYKEWDEGDVLAELRGWLKTKTFNIRAGDSETFRFDDVENDTAVPPALASVHLKQAAESLDLIVPHAGKRSFEILIPEAPPLPQKAPRMTPPPNVGMGGFGGSGRNST